MPARLSREGRPRAVAGAVDLTVYRVAQEALTNVLKHAGPVSRVDVVLRYGDDAVELLVRDDGRGARAGGDGRGQGLLGMRERVALHDGTLEAGPSEHGFAVHAVRRRVTARVFLVDDQALVRAGFRMLIEAQPDMEVVGEAEDGRAALEALAVTHADVVLMDVRMPELDGVQATERLLARRQRAEGDRADDVRPRRVRVRRDPRRRERLPAQGRAAGGAARRDPRRARRRRRRRAQRHAAAARARRGDAAARPRRTRGSSGSRRASARSCSRSPRGARTPRSAPSSSWPKRRSRPTSGGC